MVPINEHHIRLVYEIAASYLGRGKAAEDVCYEVFLSLLQSGAYAPLPQSLPTYLEIITRLRAKESAYRMRRKRRAKGSPMLEPFRVHA